MVDFAFKKIFGSPENAEALMGLLNAILDLDEPIVGVEVLNPFSYQEFADAKLVVLDVRARDSTGRSLNIEMQLSTHPSLLERLTYETPRLRERLPSVTFQQAISVIETIANKTDDRIMYDQRTKAQMDYDWAIEGTRLQGLEQGLEQGREEGVERGFLLGRIQLLQQLLDEPQSPMTELIQRPTDELASLQNELQNRLRQRDA
ncbi:MAG: PD-(D/E)XK nuclease family transposase [Planctomycetaceae bacterium]